VPLAQVAKLSLGWEPGVLWREGRDYAVTVQGDVVRRRPGPTVTAQLWSQRGADGPMKRLMARMPPGYQIQIAGAVEKSSKGQGAIAAGVPVMLFIIFTLPDAAVAQLLARVLVFLTGPMGVARAAGALLVLNRPFGFVARWA